jgi:phosphatidylglycerophosphate synthase
MSRDELHTDVVLDLRDDPDGWFASVCGLRNVVRALVSLSHAGFAAATVVGDDAGRAIDLYHQHSLYRRDPERALVATAAAVPPAPGERAVLVFRAPVVFSSLAARALAQTAEGRSDVPDELPRGLPGFLTRASTSAERRGAAAAIRRACGKPMLQSGIASVYLLQPMAQVFNRVLCRTSLTPNVITVLGFLVGMAALPLLWHGGTTEMIIAVCLLFLNNMLDQIDGQLARMKYLFSTYGEKLDHYLDEITKVVILAPIGMGLFHATGYEIWMILGWAGSGARLLYALTLAYYVENFGGTDATTTNFRFWYRVPRDGSDSKQSAAAPSSGGIKLRYFLRKDFIHSAYFAFGVFGLLEIPFVVAAFGAIEYGVISIIQLTLFHRRVGFQRSYHGDV